MKSLWHDDLRADVLHRVHRVTPATKPEWGLMTAPQTFRHTDHHLRQFGL